MNITAIFGIVLALGSLLGSAAEPGSPAKDRSVVVISLDGFPGFALEDPKLPVPTLRRLIQEGTWCRMATINPTITWPNHTAMVTGGGADEHGLLVNGTILSTNGWPPIRVDPYISKEQMVHAPTVYDAVFKAGLTTAQVDWVAINDANEIRANIALEASGLGKSVYVLPEGGSGFVYLAPGIGPEVLPKAREVFKTVDGIGEIIGQERFAALGLPMPERDPQMFQLLLTAKPGYSFSGAKGGPATAAVPQQAGSHGYLASDPDMDAIFIASGFGVKPGTKLGQVATIDVAPTIAKLLSVPFETSRAKTVLLE